MFKFIHAADIHLDSPLHRLDAYEGAPKDEIHQATRRAFDNLVTTAISERVDFVLIAGDLYDGDWKDYSTGLHLVFRAARLREAGIPIYIVAGNHDAASQITKMLKLPANVHLFATDKPETFAIDRLKVAIHGQSFARPAIKIDLSQNYPAPLPGHFNIGVLHTCASGREGHEPYAPCSLEGLRAKDFNYWALGHVHQYEILLEDPLVVFSGCIQGRHIRETGPKGCVLVTVDDRGRAMPEFRSLDVIRWLVTTVDAGGAESAYDIVERVGRHLDNLLTEQEGLPLIARVMVKGETPGHAELLSDIERWSNEIRSAAIDIGGQVWVEKIKFHTLPPANQVTQKSDGAFGELMSLFDEMSSNPAMLKTLSDEFGDLAKKVPKELKSDADGLKFDDLDWLSEILNQVRPLLLQRLMGKGISE